MKEKAIYIYIMEAKSMVNLRTKDLESMGFRGTGGVYI